MILVYPALLLAAAVLIARRDRAGGHGRRWFGAWAAVGVLFSFSLLTGFSIGLFLLPAVAVALFWVALRSPHAAEATGFLAGAGLLVLTVLAL